jgi:hypothetical protein
MTTQRFFIPFQGANPSFLCPLFQPKTFPVNRLTNFWTFCGCNFERLMSGATDSGRAAASKGKNDSNGLKFRKVTAAAQRFIQQSK